MDHRQHRPPVAARDHRRGRTWNWSGSTRTARTRSAKTPPNCAGWPEPTGVTATNDIDALLALDPDACCYNPLWPNVDELVRLLESGVNVCSSAAWITGGKQTPEDRERIRQACETGNSTIFGSGAHPGHDQHGRHGALRVMRAGRRDPDHRVGGLLDLRVRGNPVGDGIRRRTPTPPAWPRACAAKARCSPSRRR